MRFAQAVASPLALLGRPHGYNPLFSPAAARRFFSPAIRGRIGLSTANVTRLFSPAAEISRSKAGRDGQGGTSPTFWPKEGEAPIERGRNSTSFFAGTPFRPRFLTRVSSCRRVSLIICLRNKERSTRKRGGLLHVTLRTPLLVVPLVMLQVLCPLPLLGQFAA